MLLLPILFNVVSGQSNLTQTTASPFTLSTITSSTTARTTFSTLPPAPTIPGQKRIVKVGVAAVEQIQQQNIGFSVTGGAIPLAIDYLRSQGYLQNIDFQFYVNYTECDPALTVGVVLDFIKNKQVDAIIGPACPDSIRMTGLLSTAYPTYQMMWGYGIDIEFSYLTKYPYMASIMSNSLSLGYITNKVLEYFSWSRISILYINSDGGYCSSIVNAFEASTLDPTVYTANIVMKNELPKNNAASYTNLLNNMKSRSRIVLLCFDAFSDTREFFYRVNDAGMATEEYVYIIMSMKSIGFGQIGIGNTTSDQVTSVASGLTPFWIDTVNNNIDGKDASSKAGAKRAILIDLTSTANDVNWMQTFKNEVVPRVRQAPFYCSTAACLSNDGKNPGGFSRHLHDAFYLYGRSLDTAVKTDPVNGYRDSNLLQQGVQITFQGLTGEVSINENTTRNPFFMLYSLNDQYTEVSYMNITFLNNAAAITASFTDESVLWATRGGARPLTKPRCGYTGMECPKEFWEQNGIFVIVGAVLLLVIILVILFMVIYVLRAKQLERLRLNSEWQISHTRLQKPAKKSKANLSKPSLRSDPSTMTNMTGDSKSMLETIAAKFYDLYILEKDPVFVTEHEPVPLSQKEGDFFIKLRKMDHLNLNNFIGLSLDGGDFKAIWKYCSRSSLLDIINNGNMNTADSFFVFCVIRDIADGINFLHNSFVGAHGRLHSGCCLVNDGWQVKISDFGLNSLSSGKKIKDKTLLWKAPEHIREPGNVTAAGDVYSFAIIASEVINRKQAWNVKDRKESLDELLYLIKKGGPRPIRPEFDAEDLELSPAIYALVKDCWAEDPADRPTSENIKKLLRSIVPNQKQNLIDHVFNKLEEYTSTLEMEVDDRTKELVVEKKKADVLLSKMLPKQVAEKLKLGQTVEPEGFDSVSVMFMDVVKFTQLSAKCTPFQVVNLLNELFTNFDNIIDQHDVYKVESIGDGYLCVSGLPVRNGHRHIKEIVDMCLIIREYARNYKIHHLPKEKVQLRFGINSGPCVAGVVGLSMPRYCLFGDTVNTASRMESNGKPDHIHMSQIAHSTLIDRFPGQYATQSRGDVIIKGKGVMETFWVIGKSNDAASMISEQSVKDFTAAQVSPEPRDEIIEIGAKEIEKRSVDDYDVEDDDVKITHTEPLYRFYSRQTTLKAEDQ